MSTKKNKKHGISNALRVGILSLCVYATASFLGKIDSNSFLLRRLERTGIISQDTDYMLEQVEENIGMETDGNSDFTIFYAVMNNPYLTNEEKELLYSFSDLIRDNHYLDLNETYYTLENLKIEYVERDTTKYDEIIKGIFSNETKTISIFEPKEIASKEIIIHELIHSIFNNKGYTLLPEYFVEGVTELLSNEYFSKSPYFEANTYPFEIAMTKLLCEMTSSDTVMKAYANGTMDPIYQEISTVMGIKSTSDFFKNINNMFKEYKDEGRIKEDRLPEILLFMDSYYKYQYEKTNDATILDRYFYQKGIIELMTHENSFKDYWMYLVENGVYQQPYFSSKLKEQAHLSDTINIDGSPKKQEQYQYYYANESLN